MIMIFLRPAPTQGEFDTGSMLFISIIVLQNIF